MKLTNSMMIWKRPALLTALCLPLLGGVAFGADAPTNWKKHCASCHGKDGKGDTKAGKKSGAKDMTDSEYGKGRTDEQFFVSIRDGLKEDDKDVMKPYSKKLTEAEMKALVGHVHGFKK